MRCCDKPSVEEFTFSSVIPDKQIIAHAMICAIRNPWVR